MKISTRQRLKELITEEFSLLLEQDEEEVDVEEDVEAGETEGEAEGEAAEDEAKAQEIEPVGEEKNSIAKTVDDELTSIFVDFETGAINAAKASPSNESYRYSLKFMLLEQEETPQIDMETFAADIARLVMNYDSLLDMKAIIMKKAQDYIAEKYDDEKVEELIDILNLRYDLTLELPEDLIKPYAVGASVQAAEGGA